MLPTGDPLTIEGANTEENIYTRQGHSKTHNRRREGKGLGRNGGREGERGRGEGGGRRE